MTLGPGNIVQTSSGNNSSTETPTVTITVPSATTGNTVLIGISADTSWVSTAPSGFGHDAHATAGSEIDNLDIYRKQTSVGETSWDFTWDAGGGQASWFVLEVSGLDPTPLLTAATNNNISGTTASATTTSSVTATDILVLAAFQGFVNAPAITWSGYTNSFVELVDQGTTSPGGLQTSIAVAYLFPGAGGTFTTTATASSGSGLLSTAIVVYKAAANSVQLTLVGHVRRVRGA